MPRIKDRTKQYPKDEGYKEHLNFTRYEGCPKNSVRGRLRSIISERERKLVCTVGSDYAFRATHVQVKH